MLPKKILERIFALKLDVMTETTVKEIVQDAISHREADRDEGDDWPPDYLEQFWQAFPPFRREGKAKVGEKLKQLRKKGKVTWDTLIGGVRKFAATNPGEFAPAPMVWLNGGRWDREYGTEFNGNRSNTAAQPRPAREDAIITGMGNFARRYLAAKQSTGSNDGPAFGFMDTAPKPDAKR